MSATRKCIEMQNIYIAAANVRGKFDVVSFTE